MDETESVTRWESQMRKGALELAVLATLWSGARYGLEILQALAERGLEVNEGTIYPLLNRLRRDELVVTEWIEGELGHPRKYYELTSDGREIAREMSRRWRSFTGSLRSLLAPVTEEKIDA